MAKEDALMTVLGTLWSDIRGNWRQMLLHGVVFAVLLQVFMLLALIVRFQALPNYVTGYDWIGNAYVIIKSTPAWSDIAPIIWEEWLLEIGRMNYDYGTGISEWSLNVIPSRLFILFILGAMVSLCLALTRRDSCTTGASGTLRATTGLGAVLVAMTNATMSWVVCCATPTWVVGLAMLGLGVSTSLALETMGPLLSGTGFGLLVALILYLSWRKSRRDPDPKAELIDA
jgi:hypothetical protein